MVGCLCVCGGNLFQGGFVRCSLAETGELPETLFLFSFFSFFFLTFLFGFWISDLLFVWIHKKENWGF